VVAYMPMIGSTVEMFGLRLSLRLASAAAVAALVGLASAGCSSPVQPPNFGKFSQLDLKEGTGDPVNDGLVLEVEYTGWLYDASQPDAKGSVFDSSRGREPFSFTLGAGDVIQGWDEGIRGMKVGGIRRLIVPPSKAYEGSRTGGIPPYSTLVFEIELLSAESPISATSGL
jgi:FKBP-type peptidyl-prolyl cis-trans isomerase FkpA